MNNDQNEEYVISVPWTLVLAAAEAYASAVARPIAVAADKAAAVASPPPLTCKQPLL